MELTLDQLVAAVAERIVTAGLARQANGQVSPFPDRRTLRYYTTIGLLDRPHAVRDRQSVYGEGHLLQAVAVKRLQAGGLALAEIQARLSGLPPDEVRAIAEGHVVPAGRAARFWAGRPGDVAGVAAAAPAAPRSVPPDPIRSPAPRAGSSDDAQPLLAIPLAPDVTVLIPAGRSLTSLELAGIRLAAGPLLDHLAAAGLTGAEPKDRP